MLLINHKRAKTSNMLLYSTDNESKIISWGLLCMIKSLEIDLFIIALISIHFRVQHIGKAMISTFQTK